MKKNENMATLGMVDQVSYRYEEKTVRDACKGPDWTRLIDQMGWGEKREEERSQGLGDLELQETCIQNGWVI